MLYEDGVIYGTPHRHQMWEDKGMDNRTQAFSILNDPDFALTLEVMPSGRIICSLNDEYCWNDHVLQDLYMKIPPLIDPAVEYKVCLMPPDELEGF